MVAQHVAKLLRVRNPSFATLFHRSLLLVPVLSPINLIHGVTGRRGRRWNQLIDYLKERRRYYKLKDEAPDRTLWRIRFGKGCVPVVRQTTE